MYTLFYYQAEITAVLNAIINFILYVKPPYIGNSFYTDVLDLTKFTITGLMTSYFYYYCKFKYRRKIAERMEANYPPIRLNIKGEYT